MLLQAKLLSPVPCSCRGSRTELPAHVDLHWKEDSDVLLRTEEHSSGSISPLRPLEGEYGKLGRRQMLLPA